MTDDALAAADGAHEPAGMTAMTQAEPPAPELSDDEIAQAGEAVRGKTELEALIAYLQVLGTAVK